jgi:hypothetical protein
MRMLRSWAIKIPNMNKIWQRLLVICLLSHFIHLCKRILYRFHRWLIFARVIALFMFVWPYVRSHILCMQQYDKRQMTSCVHKMCRRKCGQTNMKRAITFAKINHPWNRYNMHMLNVCLARCPFVHLVYTTSHLSFVAFYSYLVSWLAMIWACTYYTDFTDG